jgi:DNA-binding transcriptional ArsR family regulator
MSRSGLNELKDWQLVFEALSHESRRRILTILSARCGSMTAGEIAERFSCAWPTTTRHLSVLENAGLISVDKKGRERIYRIQKDRLVGVVESWTKYFESSGGSNDSR